jgi:hypothetical protein
MLRERALAAFQETAHPSLSYSRAEAPPLSIKGSAATSGSLGSSPSPRPAPRQLRRKPFHANPKGPSSCAASPQKIARGSLGLGLGLALRREPGAA